MQNSRPTDAPDRSADAHHVLADSSLTDERIRVLKHGDTFALFDQYGDIRREPGEKEGCTTTAHDFSRDFSWNWRAPGRSC